MVIYPFVHKVIVRYFPNVNFCENDEHDEGGSGFVLFLINFAKTCDLYNQCCSPTIRGCMGDQGCNCITFCRVSSLPPGSEIQISLVVQRIVLRPDQHVILEKEAMRRVNISTCLGMCFSLYFSIK